jgi:hypothetical protein
MYSWKFNEHILNVDSGSQKPLEVDIYNAYVFDTPSGSQKIATLDNNMAFKMQLWPLVSYSNI